MEGSADINISAGDNILPREAANQVAIEKNSCVENGDHVGINIFLKLKVVHVQVRIGGGRCGCAEGFEE